MRDSWGEFGTLTVCYTAEQIVELLMVDLDHPDLIQLSDNDNSLSKGDDETILSDSDATVKNGLCCESDTDKGGKRKLMFLRGVL